MQTKAAGHREHITVLNICTVNPGAADFTRQRSIRLSHSLRE